MKKRYLFLSVLTIMVGLVLSLMLWGPLPTLIGIIALIVLFIALLIWAFLLWFRTILPDSPPSAEAEIVVLYGEDKGADASDDTIGAL